VTIWQNDKRVLGIFSLCIRTNGYLGASGARFTKNRKLKLSVALGVASIFAPFFWISDLHHELFVLPLNNIKAHFSHPVCLNTFVLHPVYHYRFLVVLLYIFKFSLVWCFFIPRDQAAKMFPLTLDWSGDYSTYSLDLDGHNNSSAKVTSVCSRCRRRGPTVVLTSVSTVSVSATSIRSRWRRQLTLCRVRCRRPQVCTRGHFEGKPLFPLLKCLRTHCGQHYEPLPGQDALDCRILHVESWKFFGDSPTEGRNDSLPSAPGAWTYTPVSAWLASIPIVPVLWNDHWSTPLTGRCCCLFLLASEGRLAF